MHIILMYLQGIDADSVYTAGISAYSQFFARVSEFTDLRKSFSSHINGFVSVLIFPFFKEQAASFTERSKVLLNQRITRSTETFNYNRRGEWETTTTKFMHKQRHTSTLTKSTIQTNHCVVGSIRKYLHIDQICCSIRESAHREDTNFYSAFIGTQQSCPTKSMLIIKLVGQLVTRFHRQQLQF